MNKIWSYLFILITLIYIFSGNSNKYLVTISNSYQKVFNSILIIAFNLCFWSGITNILNSTKISKFISKLLSPIINLMFTKEERKTLDNEDYKNISTNITSNIIGIGNASTASGLKEMKYLNSKLDKNPKIINVMRKFVLINTASIQIIPFSILALRAMNGSTNTNIIVIPVIISSIIALTLGILVMNGMKKA